MDGRRLSNTVGTVLDPIFALRNRVRIPPGATVRLSFWTAAAASRAAVLDLYDKQHDPNSYVRAATLAWTQAQVQLRHLGITAEEAALFQRLAGHILYTDASMRPSSDTIRRGSGGRTALWAQGISGDVPILLLRIHDNDDLGIVRQLLQAHEYWRMKQLAVDLVILNERASSYIQDLQTALDTAVRMSQSRPLTEAHRGIDSAKGSVFVLRTDLVSAETRAVLSSAARAVFVGQRGSVEEQLDRRAQSPNVPASVPARPAPQQVQKRAAPRRELEFFNGLGGFDCDGREYVTTLDADQATPAPWINVIANPQFGFQIAVEGGGYTWSMNSRENQLTQWSNDPVTDRPGEVLYVRDEESGELWGPTLAPVRDDTAPYRFATDEATAASSTTRMRWRSSCSSTCRWRDSIKISRLTLRNTSQRQRKLSVTAYVEWVLGTTRSGLDTLRRDRDGCAERRDVRSQLLEHGLRLAGRLCRSGRSPDAMDRRPTRVPRPARQIGSARRTRYACAAVRAHGRRSRSLLRPASSLELEPGETAEIVFFLGEAASDGEARALLMRAIDRRISMPSCVRSRTTGTAYWARSR